ncbi:MAG: hypothetical protein HRU19_03090 [Pseudobacteriovorax sp.]|nr:hypothetical protein [Pseudobacteriovorax sp.]
MKYKNRKNLFGLLIFFSLVIQSHLSASEANRYWELVSLTESMRESADVTIPTEVDGMSKKDLERLDDILATIDEKLILVGELFSRAAVESDRHATKKLARKGLARLREAKNLVRDGVRLARKTHTLDWLRDLFEEILAEIEFAESIVKDVLGSNPWESQRFNSRYRSAGGDWITGTTVFKEGTGSYETTSGKSGIFYDLEYLQQDQVVQGFWIFENKHKGWFYFRLNKNGDGFQGQWGYGDQILTHSEGRWDGWH